MYPPSQDFPFFRTCIPSSGSRSQNVKNTTREPCIERQDISAYHVPSHPARFQRNLVPFRSTFCWRYVPFQFPYYKIVPRDLSVIVNPIPCSLFSEIDLFAENRNVAVKLPTTHSRQGGHISYQ